MIATLAAGQPHAQVQLRTEASVTSPVVRLSDVARLEVLPAALRSRAAAIAVARFAPGQNQISLPGSLIAERARGAMPALSFWTAALDGARIPVVRLRTQAAASPEPSATCWRALRSVDAGATVVRQDFEPASCTVGARALAYDRPAGLARAGDALDAGDVVRGMPERTFSAVRPGQSLTLRAAVGPVVVERQVEVVRPARAGAAVYVRGDGGDVFAAPPVQGKRGL
jgi:hypothetical protein